MPATASPSIASSVARPGDYSQALSGEKSHTSAWNFLAAAAATALGVEARSVVGTISGAAWMVSQVEAWVDDTGRAGSTVLRVETVRSADWRTVVGLLLLGASGVRTAIRGDLKNWRWV